MSKPKQTGADRMDVDTSKPKRKGLKGFSLRKKKVEQPSPPPILTVPWRSVNWGTSDEDLDFVEKYQPVPPEVQFLRLVVVGPVGAGKSSFINSVYSVLQGRVAIPALASAKNTEKSFTTKYETHKFPRGRGPEAGLHHFVISDLMGLEDEISHGVPTEDLFQVLGGQLMEGYKFTPGSSLSKRDISSNTFPTIKDRTHTLVFIFSANMAALNTSILRQLDLVRKEASEMGIPQMAVLTHIDQVCEEIERDVKNVYRSRTLQQKMKDISSAVGIPLNCIFPVQNYSCEISMDPDMDTLILSALRRMLTFGDDFLNKLNQEKTSKM